MQKIKIEMKRDVFVLKALIVCSCSWQRKEKRKHSVREEREMKSESKPPMSLHPVTFILP